MQTAIRWLFILLAALLLIVGLNNLIDQLRHEQEIQWHIPLILFGLGFGIPIVVMLTDLHISDHDG